MQAAIKHVIMSNNYYVNKYTLLKHSNFTNSLDNCRAARVSQANDRVLFEIKYVHTLRKQMLQLRKLDGCTLRRMVYNSAATQQALQ